MNYYEELGLSKTASESDIKKAFRKLAKENHPDKTNGDKVKEEKFKKINEAYQVLSDKDKKAEYDSMLSSGYNGSYQDFKQGGYSRGGFNGFGGEENYQDIFSEIFKNHGFGGFGGNPQGFGGSANRMPRLRFAVSFWDAINGCTATIKVPEKIFPGGVKTKVKIPEGANDGDIFEIKVKGVSFEIKLAVEEDHLYGFRRNGLDLERDLPVSFTKALIGEKVTFTHLGKELEVKIPEGAYNGQKIRIKGKGIKKGNTVGNLILCIQYKYVKSLTPRQKELLQEFEEIESKK